MYVIGGRGWQGGYHPMGTYLLFNMETKHWEEKMATGDIPQPRADHTTTGNALEK